MRPFLAFLLSLLLSFNAAYAGVSGICDALEHLPADLPAHAMHPGHHDHHDATDHADAASNPDNTSGNPAPAIDHCHSHAGFSGMTIAGPKLPLVDRAHPLVASTPGLPASAAPARLERPPRAALA